MSLLGDGELDEGAILEAVADPAVARMGELLWVVDTYRSIDTGRPTVVFAYTVKGTWTPHRRGT